MHDVSSNQCKYVQGGRKANEERYEQRKHNKNSRQDGPRRAKRKFRTIGGLRYGDEERISLTRALRRIGMSLGPWVKASSCPWDGGHCSACLGRRLRYPYPARDREQA